MSERILLIGAGGHARACIDVIEQQGQLMVAGLVGTSDEVGTKILGYPVLGTDVDLPRLLREFEHAFVAVGQIKSASVRIRLFETVRRNGRTPPLIVSPNAYVSPHARLGPGTIVMHGAVVNAGVSVGCNCIINSRALIEHDVIISDHCHIATGAVVNGDVRVGAGTFVGSNACVRQAVSIGEGCIIGMGQRVFKDCASGACLPGLEK